MWNPAGAPLVSQVYEPRRGTKSAKAELSCAFLWLSSSRQIVARPAVFFGMYGRSNQTGNSSGVAPRAGYSGLPVGVECAAQARRTETTRSVPLLHRRRR